MNNKHKTPGIDYNATESQTLSSQLSTEMDIPVHIAQQIVGSYIRKSLSQEKTLTYRAMRAAYISDNNLNV